MSRLKFALASLLALGALTSAASAHAAVLSDSTTSDSWRLANGLEVRIRSVPGAAGASVSLAYRAGALHMPPGRAGLADLLAELQFTAAAGAVPERTRGELTVLRPAGWELRINDQVTVLTEVAAPSQLPGVMLQVAARAHGVQVGDSCYARALATVRSSLARTALGKPDVVMHHGVRAVALGLDDARILEEARGQGLAGVNAAAAGRLLEQLYVPANATLAIAGDLGGMNPRAVVEQLFGDIPAGKPEPEAAPRRLQPGSRTALNAGIRKPVGVVAVIAPALDDSLHAAFYLAELLAGAEWRGRVGAPQPPLSSVFRYSVLDEPDLARFYVQSSDSLADAATLTADWSAMLEGLAATIFLPETIDQARMSVDWFLGGPISPPVRAVMRRDPAALSVLSTSMATRGCWRGDRFWDGWRMRFETGRIAPENFFKSMLDPRNRATLLLEPRR